MKSKVLVIYGTRPELIKLAPVIVEMQRHPGEIETIQLATAQHRDMLDQMLAIFSLKPDIDLNVMTPNQTLEMLSSEMLKGISAVLDKVKPDWVVVQGDTTTAMIASLAAFYKRIAVAHVEAGLRTDDIYNPFPEEINRRIISVLGTLHFPPTPWAYDNLVREGIPKEKLLMTGNTVVDALLHIEAQTRDYKPDFIAPPGLRMVLVTAHRRENHGAPFDQICHAILDIVARHPDVVIVYPVHPNPNVAEKARQFLSGHERIHLLKPQNYLDFLFLMKQSYLILTDSGGVQEEAPTFGKPVLVMRKVTERPEGVNAGVAKLVGTDRELIVREVGRLLDDPGHYRSMAATTNPYGDGRASERIVRSLRPAAAD
jgi:UDP-N-acetylglucosamine 2-epimerase